MRTIDDVVSRLRAEYLEMPGLRLTSAQVQRLCGIEGTLCHLLLESLVDAKFLCVSSDGHYARLTDGGIARPRRTHADLSQVKRVPQTTSVCGDAALMETAQCSG